MATLDFTDYDGLQAAILSFIERPGDTDTVKGWIALAEARLNRKLSAVEVDTPLTGTAGSRDLSVSSLSIARPIALKRVHENGDERDMVLVPLGTISLIDDSGKPTQWAYDVDDQKLVLNRPCDQAYSFRFIYREKFALSDSATTNWLLTNHPDVYLAASLLWGAAYREEIQNAVGWKAILDEGLGEIRREIAAGKVGTLGVDHALLGKWPVRGVNLTGEI